MNESRSFRRLQDEASEQNVAQDQGEETCGLCGDDCRGQEFEPSMSPFFGALFGAMPSQEEIDQIRREATRDALLGMLSQAQNAISNGMEAARMIVEIVDDELAGL